MSFQEFSAFTAKCLYLIPILNSPSALPMCYNSSSLLLTAQITRDHTYVLSQYSFLISLSASIFHCRSPTTFLIIIFCSFSCLHPAHSFLEVNYAKQDAVCPYSGCEEIKNYSTRVLGYASAYTVQNAFSSFQAKDHFEFQFFVLKICPRMLSTHRNLIPSSKSNEE